MSEYSRGGLWTNAEDEILKAAVSKYGLTQWARCSSLLNRKTAKQCKARWYNWLSPSIDKSPWSASEDEKLLEMAKILPNQWQTVATIVGRTPHQCLQRYQQLLDDLEIDLSNTTNVEALAPQGAKVDLMNTVPETEAAKPDEIDMDDEEKEMISEARARLANTMGKKAKRKQRERLLKQTRRISLLERRRELQKTGSAKNKSLVSQNQKRKNKHMMDYNDTVAFEEKPEPGIYDVKEEATKDLKAQERFRKEKMKRDKVKAPEQDLKSEKAEKPEKAKQIAFTNLEAVEDENLKSKKRKLGLPAPANGETQDLPSRSEKMRKIGQELKENQSQSLLITDGTVDDTEVEVEKKAHADVKKPAKPDKKKKSVLKFLRQRFKELPQPKNDYDLNNDESSEEEEHLNDGEVDLSKNKEGSSDEDVVQAETVPNGAISKDLPIPYIESKKAILRQLEKVPVGPYSKLIDKEMVNLMISDYSKKQYSDNPDEYKKLENDEIFKEIIVKDISNEQKAAVEAMIEAELYKDTEKAVDDQVHSIVWSTSYALPGLKNELEKNEQRILGQSLISQIKQLSAKCSK